LPIACLAAVHEIIAYFMGIPGSGRRVEFECVLIYDFQDGLIRRERRIDDFTGMLIQAGVLRGKPVA
jgi:predicted ester cyclase